MDGAITMESCMDSILPVVPTCEGMDLGFEIAQGGASARSHRQGVTVQELVKDDQLFTLPVEHGGQRALIADAHWLEGAQQTHHNALVMEMDSHEHAVDNLNGGVATRVAAAAVVILVAARATVVGAVDVVYVALGGKQLRQHCIDGHRPYHSGCPFCVRANTRERAAHTQLRESYADPNGYVLQSDFSGPHAQDIDGHTQVYVGVDASTGYGYVGLLKSRSASETLESIKTFESELKQHSGDPDRRVVGFHHDDKSFRGPVEKHA